jgi:hypothetical protein
VLRIKDNSHSSCDSWIGIGQRGIVVGHPSIGSDGMLVIDPVRTLSASEMYHERKRLQIWIGSLVVALAALILIFSIVSRQIKKSE